jgi:hypothetical protein
MYQVSNRLYEQCNVATNEHIIRNDTSQVHYLTVQLPNEFPNEPPCIISNNSLSKTLSVVQSIPGYWLSSLIMQMKQVSHQCYDNNHNSNHTRK